MVDVNKNIEIPKLYLRPKSADGNCYRGSQTSDDMKYQRETHSKSALGSYENERTKKVNYVISKIHKTSDSIL
jgi:hypothetical protein